MVSVVAVARVDVISVLRLAWKSRNGDEFDQSVRLMM